jgi:uncharacterized protein (DUF1697 family)
MANRLVALFRGINVGRAKRIAMADLRAHFEKLGYSDVQTLLNSGNVVFTAPRGAPSAAADRIEKAVAAELGVTARVTVLTAAELADIVCANSLLEVADNHSRLLAAVLRDPADHSKFKPLLKQDWSPEAIALGPRVAYVWCADGILESRVAEAVNRSLGDGVTARNWATMMKLNALATS